MSFEILNRLREELEEGRSAVLVSVTAFQGSVPRKDHPRQLFLSDGGRQGTVGGGCVDGFAQTLARRVFAEGGRLVETYRLDGDDAEAAGLLCGGSLELEVELHEPGPAALERVREMLADPGLRPPRLTVFGGGHVGLSVARFAHAVGFTVQVHDDRDSFVSEQRFPFASRRLSGPVATADAFPPSEVADAVLVATRGHRQDLEALRWAARSEAGYLGLLGSVRKRSLLLETLAAEGHDPVRLAARLRCPVGLAIGALTAEEIGLAAAAELVAYRRGALVAPTDEPSQ
jgi:xanthine dehydrogenase accessory factor